MPRRPEKLPEWALSLLNVQEPLPGKKDVGWLPGEEPPAQYLNWLQNLSYQWHHYQRDQELVEVYNWGPLGDTWGGSLDNRELIPGKIAISNDTLCNGDVLGPGAAVGPAPHTSLRLEIQDAANNRDNVVAPYYVNAPEYRTVAWLDSLSFEMEWRSYFVAGVNEVDYGFGLHADPTTPNFDDETLQPFFLFRLLDSDTNWQARASNGATGTTVDTGVAPVADTWQKFRIEYEGADTEAGVANSGAPVIRYYIDDDLVAEIASSSVPSGNTPLGFMIRFDSTIDGPSGTVGVVVGPVRLAWNALSPVT